MKKNSYHKNDVCIVGIGCVLPEADNPQEFWTNISNGNCSIKKIPEERWKSRLYFSLDKKEEDKTYSNTAAFVGNNQLKKIYKKFKLNPLKDNRLHAMALGATVQALDCINPDTLNRTKKNTAVFLGCMEADEAYTLERFYLHNKKSLEDHTAKNNIENKDQIFEKIKKYFNPHQWDGQAAASAILTNSVVNLIKQKFNLEGEGALIDAACASSLAALDVAVASLKNYKVDLAVSGGIESNLAPDTFVLFSKVGALSPEKCLPFDERSQGLSQGEGAVVFVLQRLEDAIKDKNKIYGVIKSIGSSSDGKNSSLFSPSVKGQMLALERAYKDLPKNSVDYIECHGTGTKIGDATELASLNMFFKGEKIPIGSVKSLIGHTKGAAGASGMLKCLLSLQNKKISSSKYLESFMGGKNDPVYINKKTINIESISHPLRFGISSFGFGNVNYHVVLDEFEKSNEVVKTKNDTAPDSVVVLGRSSMFLEKIDFDLITAKFKIPPQSLLHIDKVQLQALLAVSEAFEKSNIKIDSLDKEQVTVISASCLGLDSAVDLVKRVRHFEFNDALNFLDKVSLDLMIRHKNKFPEITEDTGSGVLNNVIAGRICNSFDLKGENFNVDCDFNSFPVALNIAAGKLQEKGGIIILVYCEEELNKDEIRLERKKINCMLLSTLGLAKKNDYPIREIIERINYYDSK